MVSERRKRGRPQKNATRNTQVEVEEEEVEVEETYNDGKSAAAGYEQSRQERIKENLQRMQKLGILDLSHKLKPPKRPKITKKTPTLPPSGSPRRSSRLTTMTRVSYAEKVPKKEGKPERNVEIHIVEGSKPEIYTEEHEQLLGDCKTTWTLYVDGYGEDGQRIYDQYEGKSCHQCRQKTLGQHTECSTCKLVQGQLCGDCLFMRYGENVTEANENPSWTCPVCRGICNCSRCRRDKGWEPTGPIYRKVEKLGFKSVAHYLIQSRQPQKLQDESTGENPNPAKGLLPFADGESESTYGISKPQTDHKRGEEIKEDNGHGGSITNKDGKHEDSDADYDAVDDDDDDGDCSSEEEDNGKNI